MTSQGSMVIKFFKKLVLFVPMLVIVGGFSYAVDPAYMFKPNLYEKGLADLLLQKRTITNLINYNERILQKFYITGLKEKKDIVVMGSSRAFLIGTDLFPGRNIFNNAVSGAVLEDNMAIYQLYRQKKLLPNLIILNLDPWILNRNNAEMRWQFLLPEFNEIAQLVGIDVGPVSNPVFRQYIELLSPSYFQSAIRFYKKTKQFFSNETDKVDENIIKYPDGTIQHDSWALKRTVEEVRVLAKVYEQFNRPYHLRYFDQLDTKTMENMEKFIKFVKADGVRLVIFLPPYHPVAYDILMKDQFNRNIMKAQEFYIDLARQHDIEVVGSFNPNDSGLVEADFLDAMHLRPEGIKKILSGISLD